MMLDDAVGDGHPRRRRRMDWLWKETVGGLKVHLGCPWSLYLWRHI